MSFTSPFKKSYTTHHVQASSSMLKVSEQLTDSNILQSRKTYGRKKDDRTSSISSESSGSFSVSTSEDLKNNGMLSFTDFNEESYSEENFDFIASITDSYSENSTFQNGNFVDSEFSLYTEKDMEYLYSEKIEQCASPSIPDVLNSCSNYQRTRKNQKNRLSNQQYGSEETYESTLCSDSFVPLTDTNESKSASNVLNFNPVHAKQNSQTSGDNQLKHKKTNGIQSTDDFVSNFSKNQNFFEAGGSFGRQTISQNSLKNTKLLPILDLVNRFTASRNQDKTKSKQTKKRKKVKEESGSVPAKKIAPAVKVDTSSKTSSIENKIPISVKKFSKNTVIKSDIVSTASYLDTFKEDGVKTPLKSTQKNSRSVHKSERSPSKSVRKKKCVSASNVESVDLINNASKTIQFKKGNVKTPSKAVQKKNSRFVNDTERNVGLLLSVNGIVKTSPETVQMKNAKSVNSLEKSIKCLKKYVSKHSPVKNYAPAKVKAPSSIVDLPLVRSKVDEDGDNNLHMVASYCDDRQIETSSYLPAQDCAFQNQTRSNLNGPLNMPMIIAPMPPTFEKGAAEVIPLGIWKTVPAITDTNAVSNENLSIPGPSILSNDHLNINGSDSNLQNLETSESIYFITDDTTTTTFINESHVGGNKQNSVFRPRTHVAGGVQFFQILTNTLKNIEDNCLLHCKDQSSQTFLRNSALLNITVEDFYNNHEITDVLLDYLSSDDMGNSVDIHNTNEGYDFPENFETENLLRVVKDFVHTTISRMIPENTNKSFSISKSQIMQFAMMEMSSREVVMMTRVFQKTDNFLGLKDVLARLSIVALFVIYDEYRNKKCR